MPVTMTSLTSDTAASASSAVTASITPTANRLVLLAAVNYFAGAVATPTASGNGLTYVQVATVTYNTGQGRVTLFRAMGASPSAGAITIDFGGQTQTNITWSVAEFGSVNTSGTNGSGAVVQSVTDTGSGVTNLTVTLAAFGSTDNATYGGLGLAGGLAVTPGSGFTEIHEVQDGDSGIETEWRNDNDTTVDWSWGFTRTVGGIAIEIKFASQAGGTWVMVI